MQEQHMTPKKSARVFKFGPSDSLVGSITESAQSQVAVGAILWGMGVAEMQLARRFARQGIVSMQVRLEDKDLSFDKKNELYDTSGVIFCRAAMDKLAAEKGVTAFILMGNCAAANLCFNAAVVDRRVTGLVLTNPHVSEIQTLGTSFLRKPFKLLWWKKLLTGRSRLFRGGKSNAMTKLKWLAPILIHKLKGTDAKSAAKTLLANYHHRGDIMLAPEFDEQLQSLVERGVKTLMVCTHTEAGLSYLRQTYGKTLIALQRSGSFLLEIVKRDSHVFSNDDIAAAQLNEVAAKWLEGFLSPAPAAALADEPKTQELLISRTAEVAAI
jgi:hypothetical protein